MAERRPPITTVAAVPDGGGLLIAPSAVIAAFLSSSAISPDLPDNLRTLAAELSSRVSAVPYRSLRSIWLASAPSSRPRLDDLFAGAEFVLDSPRPREKSAELKERLRKLEELAEKRAYMELVKDVVPKEENVEAFSSYKDQIGFGLHVILIMATGYMVGFIAFRSLFNRNPVLNAAGGICGLVIGMMLETLLFIIRSSSRDSPASRTRSKLKKH